jgi:antitoxin MazE
MRVQISKWGNSPAVRLPKRVADALGLKLGQELDLVVEGRELRLKPVLTRPEYRIEDLVGEMLRLGPEHEPAFEDWTTAEIPWPDTPTDRR